MKWPRLRRHWREPDREDMEMAKLQLEVARAIEENSALLAHEHQEILRRNNLGPKIHRALGGH